MKIDIFKRINLWDELSNYNSDILEICSKYKFATEGEEYDLPNKKVSFWFNPDRLKYLHIAQYYPKRKLELTGNPKFNLILYHANYLPLYLANKLFPTNVQIEDMAGGMGQLIFYLSKLGFNDFHITERFTQVCESMLSDMMAKGNITYKLNKNEETLPKIINLSEWTHITRVDWPKSCELFTVYNNPGIVYEVPLNRGLFVRSYNRHIEMPNMRFLCSDTDNPSHAYCREDKYNEFYDKLK